MDNRTIKENIRKIRKEKNLTQEEMAHRLDISLTAYRDLEKGITNIINGNVIKIADLLGTSTEELVLGYRPSQADEAEIRNSEKEYGRKLEVYEQRIEDLEKLVQALYENLRTKDDIIESKNEIIAMLKKSASQAR